jgi:hypothetical protein
MILLFYILKNPQSEKIQSACADIEMSIEVFTAMGHHRVAKRCLELVSEVFELAKKAIRENQAGPSIPISLPVDDGTEFFTNLIDPFLLGDYAFDEANLGDLTPGVWNAFDPNMTGEGSNALETFMSFSASR